MCFFISNLFYCREIFKKIINNFLQNLTDIKARFFVPLDSQKIKFSSTNHSKVKIEKLYYYILFSWDFLRPKMCTKSTLFTAV